MIISHKYRFIFIKTFKTAGTSLEVLLSQYCDSDDIVTPFMGTEYSHRPRNSCSFFNPFPELLAPPRSRFQKTVHDLLRLRRFYNHMPAHLVKHRISRQVWDSYFKFCIERNPWDKALSHYWFKKDSEKLKSFDDYIQKGYKCFNYPLYTSPGKVSDILVDKVVKYENLTEDLGEVFQHLNIPWDGALAVRAKGGARKDKRHYREVLSSTQASAIEKCYSHEISLHNYKY